MKILAIIPARGGSKGVPRKNIKLLGGKPLIQYSIETALQSNSIDTVMVSTDDEEIAAVSRQLGAEVPELRPAHLASDTSPTIDTVIYTLKYYQQQGRHFDTVCLLQPTSPFRTEGLIDEAVTRLSQTRADALVTVCEVPHQYNPHWVFEPSEEGMLCIATGEKEIITRRQALPPAYYRNGSVYLTKTSILLEQRSLYGERLAFLEMPEHNNVNIDTLTDWQQAEYLIKHNPTLA